MAQFPAFPQCRRSLCLLARSDVPHGQRNIRLPGVANFVFDRPAGFFEAVKGAREGRQGQKEDFRRGRKGKVLSLARSGTRV
jgi:hypothetical protein